MGAPSAEALTGIRFRVAMGAAGRSLKQTSDASTNARFSLPTISQLVRKGRKPAVKKVHGAWTSASHGLKHTEWSIDPDLWRTAGWEEEFSRHFFDMDAYGSHPFKEVPHDYDEAVKKHGVEFVTKNGTLPWRAAEVQTRLTEAFRQKEPYSRENITFFSSLVDDLRSALSPDRVRAEVQHGELVPPRAASQRPEALVVEPARGEPEPPQLD